MCISKCQTLTHRGWGWRDLMKPVVDTKKGRGSVQVSNEERAAGCLGDLLGMKSYLVLWGLFHKPWNKDPYLNNQEFMESKEPGFLDRGSGEWYSIFFLLYRCVLGFAAPWQCFVFLLDDWMIFFSMGTTFKERHHNRKENNILFMASQLAPAPCP